MKFNNPFNCFIVKEMYDNFQVCPLLLKMENGELKCGGTTPDNPRHDWCKACSYWVFFMTKVTFKEL